MKSVSFSDGSVPVPEGVVPFVPVVPFEPAPRAQSRLPSWTPRAVYRGDDLPGVPLDCFTSSMIDDGDDPAWVPYEHHGCDPPELSRSRAESPSYSDEEEGAMEVDED